MQGSRSCALGDTVLHVSKSSFSLSAGLHESTSNCLVLGAYRTILQAALYDLHPDRTLYSSQNAKARFTTKQITVMAGVFLKFMTI